LVDSKVDAGQIGGDLQPASAAITNAILMFFRDADFPRTLSIRDFQHDGSDVSWGKSSKFSSSGSVFEPLLQILN
jgi:hypothetical protein